MIGQGGGRRPVLGIRDVQGPSDIGDGAVLDEVDPAVKSRRWTGAKKLPGPNHPFEWFFFL